LCGGWAVSLADRTNRVVEPAELGRCHEQEAAGAHELIGAFGLHAIAAFSSCSCLFDLEVFLILVEIVITSGDPILEDGVEIGLDVVRIELLVILELFFLTRPLAEPGSSRLVGNVIVLVGEDFLVEVFERLFVIEDLVIEDLVIEDLVVEVFFVELVLQLVVELIVEEIVVSHGSLYASYRQNPRPG
jgi:hypothetical protein